MNIHSSTYLENQHTYKILDDLLVKITVTNNPYGLSLEQLFAMAARNNKKRAFLFVSKLLGKHIPVHPVKALLSGKMLAERYLEEIEGISLHDQDMLLPAFLRENYNTLTNIQNQSYKLKNRTIFIGFAETATALGHSVFESFTNAHYIHTTRDVIEGLQSSINFEEEHSHATSHRCYAKEDRFENNDPIVLIDDEITTGKTALNIIRSIQSQYPRKNYTIVSLLDWRSNFDKKKFAELEKELKVKINVVSLLSGEIEVSGNPITTTNSHPTLQYIDSIEQKTTFVYLKDQQFFADCYEYVSINSNGTKNLTPYMSVTGRFGVDCAEREYFEGEIATISADLRKRRKGTSTLCLGTGEFMYIPMKIAAQLGDGVSYQSTTKSPVHIVDKKGYGVQTGYAFNSLDDPEVMNYVYNIPFKEYDEVFVFIERSVKESNMESMKHALKMTGIPYVHFIVFQ